MFKPRSLTRITDLEPEEPVRILCGSNATTEAIARRAGRALEKLDVPVELLGNPTFNEWKCGSGVTLLLGNLADCEVVKELYYRFLLVTDKTYPGPGGYELRTLCDPLGLGSNILFLGYSDEDGLEAGWQALEPQIALSIPFLNEIHATGFPLPRHERHLIRSSRLPEPAWRASSDIPCVNSGYLGYLSGDSGLLDFYFGMWGSILEYGLPRGDHNIKDRHLWLPHYLSSFRLLEVAGLIPEALMESILNHLFEWVESEHGLEQIAKDEFTIPGHMRQNHGLLPALGLAYFADYLDTHHPNTVDTRSWWKLIWEVYEPYKQGSWKPACDGLCHGWYLSQPALLDFGLLEPDRHYFKKGGAWAAAECALAVINPLGWMPSAGDSHLLRSFPGKNLRMAAAYYQDGRFAYGHGLTDFYRRQKSHIVPVRTFDCGIGPREPTDHLGVHVIGMDPVVYATGKDAGTWKTHYFQTPPSIPRERCFDKLAFRSGWERNAAYLLLDGLGGGSHAYWDALEIMDFTSHGYSFLVSETGSQYPETESHGVLTLYREGLATRVPEFAELLDAHSGGNENGYARAALRQYLGADWIREIFFFGSAGIGIVDTVRAVEPGLYTAESHFRIPGSVEESDSGVLAHRRGDEAPVTFGLCGWSNLPGQHFVQVQDKTRAIKDLPSNSPQHPEESREEAWIRRYRIEEKRVSVFTQRVSAKLEAGETIRFVHAGVVQSGKGSLPAIQNKNPDQFQLILGAEERLVVSREAAADPDLHSSDENSGKDIPTLAESSWLRFSQPISQFRQIAAGTFAASLADDQIGVWKAGSSPDYLAFPDAVHTFRGRGVEAFHSLLVSHGGKNISQFDSDLKLLWKTEIEPIPSSAPWWELEDARGIALEKFSDKAGSGPWVIGCGDMQVRGLTETGEWIWDFRYQNGVPGQLKCLAHPQTGHPLVAVAGEIISNQSTLRILNSAGELILEIPIEGWTSKLPGLSLFSRDNQTYLAAGATRGCNLQVYRLKEVHGSDALAAEPVFSHYVGGAVSCLSYQSSMDRLIVGTQMGILMAFDLQGGLDWTQVLPQAVENILGHESTIFAGCAEQPGGCFDTIGKLMAHLPPSPGWKDALIYQDQILFPRDQEIFSISLPAPVGN